MEREHRISVGAVVIQEGRILLVRYKDRNKNVFWLAQVVAH
jgi:ADP-ribose pyrophosphatase YjhB (NUDIX family)